MPIQPINFASITPQGNPFAQQLMPAIQQGLQTAYMPRMMEADIFSKQAAPLAQIASNPMLWALLPKEQQQMLANAISNLMPNNRAQQGSGFFDRILGGKQQESAPFQPTQAPEEMNQALQSNQSSSSLKMLPGGGDIRSGAVGKAVAPFQQSPYALGKVTQQAGEKPFVTPTEQATVSAQTALQGIENVTPILNRISEGANKWLQPGMKGSLKAGQIANLAKQYGGNLFGIPDKIKDYFGITDKDISDYAAWQADQQKAVETIMKSRQWPNDMLALEKISEIVQPQPGEGTEYGQRVKNDVNELNEQLAPAYRKTLGSGFELENNFNPKEAPKTYKEAIHKEGQRFKADKAAYNVHMVDDNGNGYWVHKEDVKNAPPGWRLG